MVLYNGADCDLTKRHELRTHKKVEKRLVSLYTDMGFILDDMQDNGPFFDYDQHAKAIAAMSTEPDGTEEQYAYTVIDSAAMAKAGYSETAAEIFERNGVTGLIEAAKERVLGWNAVHTYLRWEPDKGSTTGYTQPMMQVFSTCVNMIRTFPLLIHDEKHPEDLDSSGEDHAQDECRYLLRTLREVKAQKPQSPVERRLKALRDRNSNSNQNYQYSRPQYND